MKVQHSEHFMLHHPSILMIRYMLQGNPFLVWNTKCCYTIIKKWLVLTLKNLSVVQETGKQHQALYIYLFSASQAECCSAHAKFYMIRNCMNYWPVK